MTDKLAASRDIAYTAIVEPKRANPLIERVEPN
jgi:hypothetical protein